MERGNKNFDLFVSDKKDKIQHINVDGKTWHGNNGEATSVNHIFIPKNWQIENVQIISSNGTSNHDALCAKVRRK